LANLAKMFAYTAKDHAGQVFAGSLFADNEAAVAAFVREQGGFVTKIKEAQRFTSLKSVLNDLQPVSAKDMAVFCRQFATMVDAGLSLVVCLNVLVDQSYDTKIKESLRDISRKVQEGETLSQAMKEHPHVYPEMMVSMMEAAELGGVLDVVLNRLAVHFEKEHKLTEKVKSAMMYPAAVLALAGIAVAFILTFVIPTFTEIFTTMNMQLPLPTRMLMAASSFIRSYGLILAPVLVIVGYGLNLYMKQPRIRQFLDRFILRIPIFGSLFRKIAIARFSRTLGTLLRGGVPIISALEVVKKTVGNQVVTRELTAAQAGIREGVGLAAPLSASSIFTPMVIQMVAVGEEAGELDKMLDKVADFYESDVDDFVGRLSSLLEPILMAVLAVIVGSIIISIVLPLLDAVTNFGKVN
jgi:type IV pilus assembly protein PilC